MDVELTPEQERRLAQVASKAGTSLDELKELIWSVALNLSHKGQAQRTGASELPSFALGDVKSLHRRDLYNDVD